MTQPLARGVVRVFRLTNEPGGLGLSCTPAGVSLAGVPLLRKTRTGFVARPASEIALLLNTAYGEDPTDLQSRLSAIAQALNSDDFVKAMIVAVHSRTPELTPEAARSLVAVDGELTKYNYNPDEPRDWHGRWTSDGLTGSSSTAVSEIQNGQEADPQPFGQQRRIAENASATAIDARSSGGDNGDTAGGSNSLEQTFERQYDELGPVEFAKQVIQFGDWLGRSGGSLSSDEKDHALAEYSFLQGRLSFWLNYEFKPPSAQGNLLSAALTLYQGGVNGRIVRFGNLPESMLAVAGTASLFSEGPPRRPYKVPSFEEAPAPAINAPKEMEGVGGITAPGEVNIEWNGGLAARREFEKYLKQQIPNLTKLEDNSKAFDLVNGIEGGAISVKTLNTLSVSYIKKPQEIFRKVTGYVDDAVNYEPYWPYDLHLADIESKTLHLAIPEYTSPAQWQYLIRAVIYGKDNGVSVVITRIRE